MRCLGQVVQAIVFILLVGGFMAYVADRTEPQDAAALSRLLGILDSSI